MPNSTIDMGFAINAANVPGFKGASISGTYNNNKALLNGYSFSGPVGTGASTCSVYCHGATLTPGFASPPAWTGPSSSASCGGCHETAGDGLTMGSHIVHAGSSMQMVCESCHPAVADTSHMQGSVQWNLAGISPSAQYKPAVGSTAGVAATSGETGMIAPSTAYGSCSNITCHGQGTPTWGATYVSGSTFPYSTAQCGKCHSGNAAGDVTVGTPFYSTAIPKVTLNTNAKVGAHTSHLASVDSITSNLVCTDCHGAVAAPTDPNHMNGTTDFVWGALANGSLNNGGVARITPTYANGTCTNYCHGGAMPNGDITGTNRNPSWSVAFLPPTLTPAACGTCHGFPPSKNVSTSSHFGMVSPTGFPTSSCSCHPNLNPAGTTYADIFKDKSIHIDGKVDGGGSCNGCHGYPPANKRFVPAAGNWEFARMENYTGGGGVHTVAGHVKPAANIAEAWTNCSQCHNQGDHAMSPVAFNPSSNIKVRINSRNRFANTVQAKYSSNKKDGAQHVPGRCSSIACHFQKTPKW
jgi:predicted CxxxxCH...CXXCH cytochrome family protein